MIERIIVLSTYTIILDNKISFVFAHRINTIKNADLIVFIDDKRIVEMDNHQDLIEKHGYYYNLYMSKEEVVQQNF